MSDLLLGFSQATSRFFVEWMSAELRVKLMLGCPKSPTSDDLSTMGVAEIHTCLELCT